MKGSGPGNGDGLFQVFGRRGIVRLSLLHKVFLDMLRSNRDQVNVSGRDERGLTRTPEIVSVNSMFPIFAIKIRRRNASNLSADGSFMSDFGLYRSSAEGELSCKVTSVCESGVGNAARIRYSTKLCFHTWKRALFVPCARITKLISVGKENSLKGNLYASVCVLITCWTARTFSTPRSTSFPSCIPPSVMRIVVPCAS
jgi:hypothetical protein